MFSDGSLPWSGPSGGRICSNLASLQQLSVQAVALNYPLLGVINDLWSEKHTAEKAMVKAMEHANATLGRAIEADRMLQEAEAEAELHDLKGKLSIESTRASTPKSGGQECQAT